MLTFTSNAMMQMKLLQSLRNCKHKVCEKYLSHIYSFSENMHKNEMTMMIISKTIKTELIQYKTIFSTKYF